MVQASTLVPLQSIIVPELAKSPDSARFLTHACIYLTKNKQTEVIHEDSEDLNQTKLMFWARVRKRAPSCGD